jgi:hypothetical protein
MLPSSYWLPKDLSLSPSMRRRVRQKKRNIGERKVSGAAHDPRVAQRLFDRIGTDMNSADRTSQLAGDGRPIDAWKTTQTNRQNS